jgi:hypothetical protein
MQVLKDSPNDVLGVNDENGTDSQGHTLLVNVGGILEVQHVVQGSDLAVSVSDDGELQLASLIKSQRGKVRKQTLVYRLCFERKREFWTQYLLESR